MSAAGYMFIHCIWTNGKKYQHLGLGKALIEEVEKDAYDMLGVAVMTSDGPFMANRELKSYKDAQETPAPYSVFNLCKDDRILADRYISVTRFQNILNKESGK
ncbi:MAG: hypothetical protein JW830_03290 [Bacteroidales bacterium]|nr:hypothetical protein [Bacteroidales bacterium]